MDTTTDIRLLRHVIMTVLLAAAAVVVAWQFLFTDPGMGDNRYMPSRVFGTGDGGPAMQTVPTTHARVVGIQGNPLPSGVPHAQ
jgi:hypothetical protein